MIFPLRLAPLYHPARRTTSRPKAPPALKQNSAVSLKLNKNHPAQAVRPPADARIQYLQSLILSFIVVEPAPSDIIRFGSTVEVIQNGSPEIYRIVGVDEIDLDRNHISWLSPLARALMSHRAGDRIQFRAPSGPQELTVTAVH